MDAQKRLYLGIDIGSTTAKVVALDGQHHIVFSDYRRHHSDARSTVLSMLESLMQVCGDAPASTVITGSAGIALADSANIPFEQEVVALRRAILHENDKVDVAIELGGEDAKIVYFTDGLEQRMNGSCAGGTGAFIDQMALLLDTDAAGLNELAAHASTLYPIASRCGVFAKSDIQPLLNEGARREDLAASIFQAVVNQTVSGLACGRPIHGIVALLGGPLHYLPQLRKAFASTLNLDEGHTVVPNEGQIAIAFGAALAAREARTAQHENAPSICELTHRLAKTALASTSTRTLAPLFETEQDYAQFVKRHNRDALPSAPLSQARGNVFLGVDAGSTTFKVALVDEQGRLLYRAYRNNSGDVVGCAKEEVLSACAALPSDGQGRPLARIAHATSTGYGEALVKEALRLDGGEVETMAHLRAAQQLCPEVDFVLDIGGQDMKCLRVKDGVIDDVVLNEACSSGCGSFLETFAVSMGYSIEAFAKAAIGARTPVDLGSRCTVFMNSCVKQAQKDGAGLDGIAAGLVYSVVKNALYKVIKVHDARELGRNIVVQGGTFANDAVLRAFEIISGADVIRPKQASVMGAYGAALLSRDACLAQNQSTRANEMSAHAKTYSSLLNPAAIQALRITQKTTRCSGCENTCQLVINDFGKDADGTPSRFVMGNRCERGAGRTSKRDEDIPNVVSYKNQRLFAYVPLPAEEAQRGTVGIPRALNMYENYPFWFTFFTELGFRVVLSHPTNPQQYSCGIESIPSESVCYPAKVAHGHIAELASAKVDFIFMPCIRHERKEDARAQNCFNCPIVSSYPETLRLNVETGDVKLVEPYLPYANDDRLTARLTEVLCALYETCPDLKGTAPKKREVARAVGAARLEDRNFHADIQAQGAAALRWMKRTGRRGIVLAGRPYHTDPAVNHGIPQLINDLGFAVLTEDSIAHLVKPEAPLRAVNQWTYHARLYSAAKFTTTRADLELVQLNSFGCGLDAITTDQVAEILRPAGKIYTVLKIDEVSNLGAARIRLRTLTAALARRGTVEPKPQSTAYPRVPFTRAMKKEGCTIIAPQMSPVHFSLLEAAFQSEGYNLEALPAKDPNAIDAGLRYVNNDICYPSILTCGQIMAAVESGRYDLDKLAVLIVQTGGGCRATNYIGLIRKALEESGNGHIPVISLSFSDMGEKNPGWKLGPSFLAKGYFAVVMGDVLMQCLYRTRPYERIPGSAQALYDKCLETCCSQMPHLGVFSYAKLCKNIITDFDALPLTGEPRKPRVGVVGEILVKYHPTANNNVVDVIESEGCEAVVPRFADFFRYASLNMQFRHRDLDGSALSAQVGKLGYWAIGFFRNAVNKALEASSRFKAPASLRELADKARAFVQQCNNMGEGWLMTADMIELAEDGATGIVMCSPFGCLPNHVIGKSVLKEFRKKYPSTNVVAVDYDPGASEVNQVNRIKLMCSAAKQAAGA